MKSKCNKVSADISRALFKLISLWLAITWSLGALMWRNYHLQSLDTKIYVFNFLKSLALFWLGRHVFFHHPLVAIFLTKASEGLSHFPRTTEGASREGTVVVGFGICWEISAEFLKTVVIPSLKTNKSNMVVGRCRETNHILSFWVSA